MPDRVTLSPALRLRVRLPRRWTMRVRGVEPWGTSSGDSWILHSWYLTNLEPRTCSQWAAASTALCSDQIMLFCACALAIQYPTQPAAGTAAVQQPPAAPSPASHLHEQLALAAVHLLHLIRRLQQRVEGLAGHLQWLPGWCGSTRLRKIARCWGGDQVHKQAVSELNMCACGHAHIGSWRLSSPKTHTITSSAHLLVDLKPGLVVQVRGHSQQGPHI